MQRRSFIYSEFSFVNFAEALETHRSLALYMRVKFLLVFLVLKVGSHFTELNTI